MGSLSWHYHQSLQCYCRPLAATDAAIGDCAGADTAIADHHAILKRS